MSILNRGFVMSIILVALLSLVLPAGAITLTLQRQSWLQSALSGEYMRMIVGAWQIQSEHIQRAPTIQEFSDYLMRSEVPWRVQLTKVAGRTYAVIQPVTALQMRYWADYTEGQPAHNQWRVELPDNR